MRANMIGWLATLAMVGCGAEPSKSGPCTEASGCAMDEVCEQAACRASARQGEPCREDGSCNAETNATFNGAPWSLVCAARGNLCVFEGDEGAPCSGDDDCYAGALICTEGACAERGTAGSPCDRDEMCGGVAYCHPLSHTCGYSDVGGPCEERSHCEVELTCVAGRCSDYLSAGTACADDSECRSGDCGDAGRCIGGPGELCSATIACGAALACAEALDGQVRCVRTEEKQCASHETNGSCKDRDCQEECAACEDVSPDVYPYYVAAVCVPPG
jgi:hypothetical protein